MTYGLNLAGSATPIYLASSAAGMPFYLKNGFQSSGSLLSVVFANVGPKDLQKVKDINGRDGWAYDHSPMIREGGFAK
jgi:hypothetical protein